MPVTISPEYSQLKSELVSSSMRSRSSNGKYGSFNNSPGHSPQEPQKPLNKSYESSISMHSQHEIDDAGLGEVKPLAKTVGAPLNIVQQQQTAPIPLEANINQRLFPYRANVNTSSPARYGMPPLPPVSSSPPERRSQPPPVVQQSQPLPIMRPPQLPPFQVLPESEQPSLRPPAPAPYQQPSFQSFEWSMQRPPSPLAPSLPPQGPASLVRPQYAQYAPPNPQGFRPQGAPFYQSFNETPNSSFQHSKRAPAFPTPMPMPASQTADLLSSALGACVMDLEEKRQEVRDLQEKRLRLEGKADVLRQSHTYKSNSHPTQTKTRSS